MSFKFANLLYVILLVAFSCERSSEPPAQFELLLKNHTNLDFSNIVEQTTDFNIFNYMYFFNGGGVSAGDFNRDGLIDLYFTRNTQPNKLFLNQGDFRFLDVTKESGLEGKSGWTTGVTVVDINNDGLLDIYLGQIGDYKVISGENQLYICTGISDGIPNFQEKAAAYGLNLKGFSTQASFFDYDLDGDLDLFQLNHSLHQNGTFGQKESFKGTLHPTAGDKLLRNDNGKFVDVTAESGIFSTVIGYGLGLATGDINLDGWPDIYIGNDFHENDYLYINQQDGTFKDVLTEQLDHTSRFSMGVDLADINNDGHTEIFSLDMLPEDPVILKSSLGEDEYGIFNFKLTYGYFPQFARNNLQLNNADGSFSEIGLFAGVAATDWSWAPLFFDFDHDGYKDLFISNGIPRRMNDIDYANFRRGNDDHRWKTKMDHTENEDLAMVEGIPKIKILNKFYRNGGDLKFTDISDQISKDKSSYSNGSVYCDLDNDGDLDIVVNNIEDEPFVYRNLTIERGDSTANFIFLKVEGTPLNINAIGTKLIVFKGGSQLSTELYPVRGYKSCVETGLHLGVGKTSEIDSVLIIWPDQSYQKLQQVKFNQTDTLYWQQGLPRFDFELLKASKTGSFEFVDITTEINLDHIHRENQFVEFHREALIPHMVSTEGPALAVADVNNDGLDDFFVGSSKNRHSALYLQTPNGKFWQRTPNAILMDSTFEDVDATFVDVDQDGDVDLAIAAGGNEYWGESEYLTQRVFINDGLGRLDEKITLPNVYITASCVLPADYNNDGLVDLFFGSRAVPKNYGVTPRSYLLINKGNGQFEDATNQVLSNAGLVKDGAWVDMDKDGDLDLVLAIEWQPITIFTNDNGVFKKSPVDQSSGWWNFVLPHDFDGDGDIDLVAGNTGLNSKLQPSPAQPVKLYVNDFDENGQIEQILTYHTKGREIPFATHAELTKQLVYLKKDYLYAQDFARASLQDLFGTALDNAAVLKVNTLSSAFFENQGNGQSFKLHPLPDELQFSSLETGLLLDSAGSDPSVMLAGNFFECNIEMGRYDANKGNLLRFSKSGMKVSDLGTLNLQGQVRRIKPIKIQDETCFLLGKNNGRLQVLKWMP